MSEPLMESESCRDSLRQGAVPSFHWYSNTDGFCPICGLEVTATDNSSRWRTAYRDADGGWTWAGAQGARICINFRGMGSRRLEWKPTLLTDVGWRLVYADDCMGLGDKGEAVNMDKQGGQGEFRSGANQANAPEYQNSSDQAALLPNEAAAAFGAVVNEAAETDPPPRTLCQVRHIYGLDGKGFRTGRLVIAQEQDPRFIKLTISEADDKGSFKTSNIRFDADAWEALKQTCSGYGSETIPAPEKEMSTAASLAMLRLQRDNELLRKALISRGDTVKTPTVGAAKEAIPDYPEPPRAVLRGARGYDIDSAASAIPRASELIRGGNAMDPRD